MTKIEDSGKGNKINDLVKQNNDNYPNYITFNKFFHITKKDTYIMHDKYICTYITINNVSNDLYLALKNNSSGEGYIFVKNNNKYIKAHSQMISKFLIDYKNNYLISCSYDKLIIIWYWNISSENKNLQNISSLKGHKGRIYDIDLINNKDQLLSCGMDKNIILWDIKKFLSIKKIYINTSIHNLFVRYLCENKNENDCEEFIFIYSKNKSINIIDLNSNIINESFNISCYDGSVLLLNTKEIIYQNKKYYNIIIYNFIDKNTVGIFKGCKHEIQIIKDYIEYNKIISYDIGNNLRIWNYTKKFCELTIKIDFVLNYIFINEKGNLLCGSINKTYIYS